MKKLSLILLILLLTTGVFAQTTAAYNAYIATYQAYSTQYYVSPSGSGSSCTQGTPCSVATGLSKTGVGTVIWFLPGAYTLTGVGGYGMQTSVSGTSGGHAAYVSTTLGGAVLTWTSGSNGGAIWGESGNYTDHVGFSATSPTACEAWWGSGTNHGLYAYNTVHDVGNGSTASGSTWCSSTVGGGGIEPGTSYGTIADNVIYNIGYSGNHWAHGIYIGGGNMSVYNNLVYNASGFCVQDYNNSQNDIIINNTLVNCSFGGIVTGASTCTNATCGGDYVANNVIYNSGGTALSFCGAGSYSNANTWTNNNLYGVTTVNMNACGISGGTVTNAVTGNPNFVTLASPGSGGNFALQSGSPDLGAGTSTNSPAVDINANTRPVPPAVGAYDSSSTFALTTATNGTGTGTITGCAASYSSGAAYACTLTASLGSTLNSVQAAPGNCAGTLVGSVYSGTMPANSCLITVAFVSNTSYVLTTATSGSGTGTVSGCAGSYAPGAVYSCALNPSAGSQLASVSGCGGTLAGTSYTGVMSGSNCTVTASFSVTTVLPSNPNIPPFNAPATVNYVNRTVNAAALTALGALPANGCSTTAGGNLFCATGAFTTVTISGALNSGSIPSPGPIGGTTPSTVNATTVTATSFVGPLTGNAATATAAANLSGTPALPNGTTATTQAANSADAQLATDQTVINSYATPPTAGYGSTTPEPVTATTVLANTINTVYWVPSGSADYGAAINTILAACPTTSTYQQCEIRLPRVSSGTWSTAVTITSPGVSIIGQGVYASSFSCSVNGSCLTVSTSAFSIQQAGRFEGFGISGTGTANGVGLHIAGVIGATFDQIELQNFTGGSGTGLWLDNSVASTWTERNLFASVHIYNCNKLIRFSVESGDASFGYNRMFDVRLNPNGSQTAVSIENNANVYGGTYRFTINLGGSTNTVWSQTGTSIFQSELHLNGEQNGTGGTMFNIASGAAFLPAAPDGTWAGSLPSSTFTGTYNITLGPEVNTGNPMIPGAMAYIYNPVEITNTGVTATNQIFGAFDGSLTSGNSVYLQLGQEGSAYDAMQLGFSYAGGHGSSSNSLWLGISGEASCTLTPVGKWNCPLLMENGANVPTTVTPTPGQAACIKSAGPPVVIGYCSTVVGSTGACTCN